MIERLLESRATQRVVAPPSATKPLTLEEGYGLQDALREALQKRGERVIGWKAGFTSRVTQQAFGIDHPVCGFLLSSVTYSTSEAVVLTRFAALVVEVEIAFLMKRELAGPGVTPAAAALAVEGALPALELVDVRFSGAPTAPDIVADGVYANAIVLGQPLTAVTMDLALEGVVYEQNGRIAATNTAAEVMGNPLNSLAWVANHLATRGRTLRPGDVVMSGSISALLRPQPGDVITARFTRLGTVSTRFVP